MRKFNISVNGTSYNVEVEELGAFSAPVPAPAVPAAPAAVPAAPKAAAPAADGTQVKAPMPGNILDVRVAAGDAVAAGDVLMILEAMKMENEILAPDAGRVVSVQVSKGASVNSGDVLAVLA